MPNLTELKETYSEIGHAEFMKFLSRREAFIGPIDSINFINQLIKKEQEPCTTSQKSNLKLSTKNQEE